MSTHRIGSSERATGLCTHRNTTRSPLLVSSVLRAHIWGPFTLLTAAWTGRGEPGSETEEVSWKARAHAARGQPTAGKSTHLVPLLLLDRWLRGNQHQAVGTPQQLVSTQEKREHVHTKACPDQPDSPQPQGKQLLVRATRAERALRRGLSTPGCYLARKRMKC